MPAAIHRIELLRMCQAHWPVNARNGPRWRFPLRARPYAVLERERVVRGQARRLAWRKMGIQQGFERREAAGRARKSCIGLLES